MTTAIPSRSAPAAGLPVPGVMSDTMLMLMLQFRTMLVPLRQVAPTLGITEKYAADLWRRGELPFPAFTTLPSEAPAEGRGRANARGEIVVNLQDLAGYLERRQEEARQQWQRCQI